MVEGRGGDQWSHVGIWLVYVRGRGIEYPSHVVDREGAIKGGDWKSTHEAFLFIGHAGHTTTSIDDPCHFTKKYYLLKVHKSTRHKVASIYGWGNPFKARNNDVFSHSLSLGRDHFSLSFPFPRDYTNITLRCGQERGEDDARKVQCRQDRWLRLCV